LGKQSAGCFLSRQSRTNPCFQVAFKKRESKI